MELTAIRPEMLSKNLEMTESWYRRARQTGDSWNQEMLINRALFGSKKVAFQETFKYFQKEIKSGTSTCDTVEFLGDRSVDGTESSSQGRDSWTVAKDIDGSNFVTQKVDQTRVNEIFSLVTSVIETDWDRQIVAMFLWESGYHTQLDDAQYLFFKSDFEICAEATKDLVKGGQTFVKYRYQKLAKIPQNVFTSLEVEIKGILAKLLA